MKWMGMYLLGFTLFGVAVMLMLWKTGVLASIGGFWASVGVLAALGVGVMLAVAKSGRKDTIEVNSRRP